MSTRLSVEENMCRGCPLFRAGKPCCGQYTRPANTCASLSREQAIEIARQCAKAKPQSYYAEPFQPHEWVIDAIVAAAAPPLHALAEVEKALRTDARQKSIVGDGVEYHLDGQTMGYAIELARSTIAMAGAK